MLIDWRRDDGGKFRILGEHGEVLGLFTEITIKGSSHLVNRNGHGWLEVDGILEIDGDTAKITEP